jgi:hypothetical protein
MSLFDLDDLLASILSTEDVHCRERKSFFKIV